MPHRLIWLVLAWLCGGEGLSGARADCGGQFDLLREKHGSIRAQIPAENDQINSGNPLRHSACSWSIEAPVSQTVRLEVVSIAQGSRLQVRFRDREAETGERAVFSGNGTVELTWRVEKATGAAQTLEVLFAEDSPLPQEERHNGRETGAEPPQHQSPPGHRHGNDPDLDRKTWNFQDCDPAARLPRQP
ncbi:hypothetical protein AALO_G00089580 [Alosa alosa]|uniref:CUB domain-containing protein n=1 Tax=Alosa alosa TaxID=278164 RepID=A0AAV6GR41_9TELE|nr:hypothetical protein AALO_G00089580 [Alosa alosa]